MTTSRGFRAAVLCMAAMVAGACTPALGGRLRTRDPLEVKLEQYRSGTIVLGAGDVDVVTTTGHHPELLQAAWFEVSSADEVRFHVKLSHKWRELTSLGNCEIRLLTDRGDDLRPVSLRTRRSIVQNHEIAVGYRKGGPTPRSAPTLEKETISRDLHGADAVAVFRARRLVSRDVRSYTLLVNHPKRRLRFTWDVVPASALREEE